MPNQLQGQPEVVQPLKHAHTQGLCLEQMKDVQIKAYLPCRKLCEELLIRVHSISVHNFLLFCSKERNTVLWV